MRALALDFRRRAPAVFDIAEPPPPPPGHALLEIHEIGICGTDRELASFSYAAPPEGESTLVLGHEALARLVHDAPPFLKGDWVVPMIRRPCAPACASCSALRPDLCLTGNYLERGITRAHGYFTRFAVDPVGVLIPVPAALVDVAVLAEPLSVVEKAIATALRLHPLAPRTATIAGAGPIGLLTAFALQARGLSPTVVSLEPEDHPRVLTLRRASIPYLRNHSPAPADLVFEASGARPHPEWLAPLGVLLLIGASIHTVPLDPVRMIVGNLSAAGIINAGPAHFAAAFDDLARIPRPWLDSLLLRRAFDDWPASLAGPTAAPKPVHHLK
ncbi:MAG: alcohol dehydrogenase catalytic domain-containing protein [Candidatus Solibacter usitatus]|nr:alcohol dehydrogenase catalytic domain-containing protein [Candidatus Solibacter usitatus]